MLAILTTHPIQYQVPLWRALAEEGSVPFEVWYLTDHGTLPSYDQQFGRTFAWDLDTLSGYDHRFLKVNQQSNVSSFHRLRLAESLKTLIEKKKISALWIQGWQVAAYWQAVWQANACGIPVWLRGESNDIAVSPLLKRIAKQLLLGKFFNRVQNFLYIGKANRRLYESYGVRADQLHSTPYCVDNERFIRQSEELRNGRVAIRRSWGIPNEAFCVLFAGKFITKKRPFDLINAARDPRLNGKQLHLLFVGSGELNNELRRECRVVFDAEYPNVSKIIGENTDNHAPQASFVGFLNQTEISKAYVAADCLVLPSDHRETWGLVVNEAMASGLPAIASDACGCSEDLIAPINKKFRFPLGDTSAIADALHGLMNHPCRASVLREQVGKFGVGVTVKTVKNLYASLV